jgi:5'-3' exonuclease
LNENKKGINFEKFRELYYQHKMDIDINNQEEIDYLVFKYIEGFSI